MKKVGAMRAYEWRKKKTINWEERQIEFKKIINDYKSDGLEKSRAQLLSKNYKLPKWTS